MHCHIIVKSHWIIEVIANFQFKFSNLSHLVILIWNEVWISKNHTIYFDFIIYCDIIVKNHWIFKGIANFQFKFSDLSHLVILMWSEVWISNNQTKSTWTWFYHMFWTLVSRIIWSLPNILPYYCQISVDCNACVWIRIHRKFHMWHWLVKKKRG